MADRRSSAASTSSGNGGYKYDVFISLRGPDDKHTAARPLYHRLKAHGLRAFLEVEELEAGTAIVDQIKDSIDGTSFMLIVIFSPGYADSHWCLNELLLILNTGKPILPVFCGVKPAELRWIHRTDGHGVYAQALRKHEATGGFKSEIIEKWKDALFHVSSMSGFDLDTYYGDNLQLVDAITEHLFNAVEKAVKRSIDYCDVFISDGPDVRKTFAKNLYRGVLSRGLRVFLRNEELSDGNNLTSEIKDAIGRASVQIAIFFDGYAQSNRCLDELQHMLKSKKTIIPVFYGVKAPDLRNTDGDRVYAPDLQDKGVVSGILSEWRKAPSSSSYTNGFELEAFNSDEGKLINEILKKMLTIEEVKSRISYDVFLNPDKAVQKTFANHLSHRLLSYGLRVYLHKDESPEVNNFTSKIEREDAIRTASVHIPIFSKKYAKSNRFLEELVRMVESKATILPVFYRVKPGKVRWETHTVSKFKEALFKVGNTSGFEPKKYDRDEGVLVNKIAERVLSIYENFNTPIFDVFICHRGEVKNELASHLYHRLVARGLRPFLDRNELLEGQELNSQLKTAIEGAFVHVVIFSPKFAESNWCLHELVLMLKSEADIIPVYYYVKTSDLQETSRDGTGKYAKALCDLENRTTTDSETNQQKQRFDSRTIESWREALSEAAGKDGFYLNECNGDEVLLLDKVVDKVAQLVLDKTGGKYPTQAK